VMVWGCFAGDTVGDLFKIQGTLYYVWLTTWILSYVAAFELFFLCWLKLDTQSYNTLYLTLHLRKQWQIISALKVIQLVNSPLRKPSFNVLVLLLECPSLSTPILHCSHPLKS
jgi:hypothetical protein